VRTHALATRVLLDGRRAVGVEYRNKGRTLTVEGGRVILSGGSINSPQLLMLSGIGPAGELRSAGVEVRHELPGVGKNLQDHLDICTLVHCRKKITYDHLSEVWAGLRYLFGRRARAAPTLRRPEVSWSAATPRTTAQTFRCISCRRSSMTTAATSCQDTA
jgi:choline dehydrogenase-like flavoprotein